MELLVLSALCYLGKGWKLDYVQESTAISRETVRLFISKFIKFGSEDLFNKYVNCPVNLNELNDCAR